MANYITPNKNIYGIITSLIAIILLFFMLTNVFLIQSWGVIYLSVLFFLWCFLRIILVVKNINSFLKPFWVATILFFIFAFRQAEIDNWNISYFSSWFIIYGLVISFLTLILHTDKISIHLTEYTSLISSIWLIYIIINSSQNSIFFLSLSLIWFLYNLIHNFTRIKTTTNSKFIMSIVTYFIFSGIYLNYISKLLENNIITYSPLQLIDYFIAGFWIIYILDAALKIFLLIPKKGSSYLKEILPHAKSEHVKYFSNSQSIITSTISGISTLILLVINYYNWYLKAESVIWISLSLIIFYELLGEKIKSKNYL